MDDLESYIIRSADGFFIGSPALFMCTNKHMIIVKSVTKMR